MRRALAFALVLACGEPPDGRSSPDPKALAPEQARPDPEPTASVPSLDAVLDEVRVLAAESEFGKALTKLDALIAVDPIDRARVRLTRSFLEARLGEGAAALGPAKAALAELERLGASALHRLEGHTAIGNIHWALGAMDEARAAYERGLAIDGGDTPAVRRQRGRLLFNVAMIHAQTGRYEQGLVAAQRGLEEETAGGVAACPGLSQTRSQLGALLVRLGRFEDAMTTLDTARRDCAETPGMEVARAHLDIVRADALAGRGDDRRVAQACREAASVFGRRAVHAVFYAGAIECEADALRRMGHFDEALVALSVPLPGLDRNVPEHLRWLYVVCMSKARVLGGAGRTDEATAQVQRCEELAKALPKQLRGAALGGVDRLATDLQP